MTLCLLDLVFTYIILRPFLNIHPNVLPYCSGITPHSSKIFTSATSDRPLTVTI